MSSADHPAEPTQPALPADDDLYIRQILREMAEHGMRLLRQADADPDLPIADRALIFERISRAVRRTILLEMHIIGERKRNALDPAPRPERPTTDAEIARDNRLEPPPERGERRERVETVDLERALFARPVPEIIAAIEHDLRPIQAPSSARPANHGRPHPGAAPPDPVRPQFQPPYRGPPPAPVKSLPV